MAPSLICPHCGAANPATADFCSRCGTDLRGEDARARFGAPARPPEPPASGPPATGAGRTPPRDAEAGRPASPAPGQEDFGDQPWLQRGFVGEDDVPFEPDDEFDQQPQEEGSPELMSAPDRLVRGVQGLIEPIRVAALPDEIDRLAAGVPAAAGAPGSDLSSDQLRRIRTLMAEEPLLAAAATARSRRLPSLWKPWIFVLIGLAVALPVFLQLTRPAGEARQWPGVQAAFAAIQQLPPEAKVQVFWMYDPATAGELDLVAAPVVRHLLNRGARLQIVSLLPNGPATAQRLLARVQAERSEFSARFGALHPVEARFLPGGVTVLPLAAQDSSVLAVVLAANAEDAQAWLEQVAPRNHVPVVAATGAGADPVLRPYLANSQLVGLVSGFDGGASYQRLLDETPTRAAEQRTRVQLVAQNLGWSAFLVVILLGNFAALLSGRRRDA